MQLLDSDLRILRALFGWPARELPEGALNVGVKDLGDRTDLHRNTVHRRLTALREAGVLRGFLFEPRPPLVGLVRAGHSFQDVVLQDSAELMELLEPFPFVSIAALHAESCFIHTWHPTDERVEVDVRRLKESLGAPRVRRSFISSAFPPHRGDPFKLTGLDRRVMLALRRGFDRSPAAVAEAVGVSRRTASRRIRRLERAGAGTLLPMVRPGRIEGRVLVVYDTSHRSEQARQSLAQAFPERLMGPTARVTDPMVLVPLPSVDEALRRRAQARRLPDLGDLRLSLLREWCFPKACDAWLADRVQNAPSDVTRD